MKNKLIHFFFHQLSTANCFKFQTKPEINKTRVDRKLTRLGPTSFQLALIDEKLGETATASRLHEFESLDLSGSRGALCRADSGKPQAVRLRRLAL